MLGYDQICNGSTIAMLAFLLYVYLPSLWTSLWTSMTSLLQAIGAISMDMVFDRFGRKWPGLFTGMVSLARTAVIYYTESRGASLAGKMVCGLALGADMEIVHISVLNTDEQAFRNTFAIQYPIYLINAGYPEKVKKDMEQPYSTRFSIDDRAAYLVKTASAEQVQ
ncbi:hypothetical protein BDV18DRAFT_156652 [Aspergillus unguis]